MKALYFSISVAGILWAFMFGIGTGEFWLTMAVSASLLAGIGLFGGRSRFKDLYRFRAFYIAIGITSAAVLYGVFFAGDKISAMLFSFAGEQVGSVYEMKSGADPWLVGALLLFVIGPAEEIFWRGYVQERFMAKYGDIQGWLIAGLIYALVHVWSMNFMLVMAALVCGLFWGAVFLRWRSVVPLIISHALWDVSIFLIFPVR